MSYFILLKLNNYYIDVTGYLILIGFCYLCITLYLKLPLRIQAHDYVDAKCRYAAVFRF